MYFSDHGSSNLIAFPSKYLYAHELNDAFKVMHEKGLYKELVFYLEACHAGSMFDPELPENISIYTTTAANPSESSYGEYCSSEAKVNGTLIGSCLGDEYSVRFMEDIDSRPGAELKGYTLQEQYEYLVNAVKGSHVKQYGDLSIAKKDVADFVSKAGSKVYRWIKKGLNKLKSFANSMKTNNLEFYYEIDERFNNIAKKLEKYEFLNDEFEYFLSVSSKILYIIRKNCKDYTFGHCDYALKLFDFIIEILESKQELIKNYSENELNNYERAQKDFEDRYWEYQKEFYLNIHESDGELSEKEIYNIHEKLRE
jgi:hypothetical protein